MIRKTNRNFPRVAQPSGSSFPNSSTHLGSFLVLDAILAVILVTWNRWKMLKCWASLHNSQDLYGDGPWIFCSLKVALERFTCVT